MIVNVQWEEMDVYEVTGVAEETYVSLGLFVNVSNAGQLRTQAAAGKLEAVLLDPTLIVSPFHVLAAVNKALLAREQEQMKTRNIYSEIIFSLSPTSNISNSFKRFGVKDDSSSMLVVMLHNEKSDERVSRVCENVQGTLTSIGQLESVQQCDKIIQFYEISEEEKSISSLESSVVTRLAIKDIS